MTGWFEFIAALALFVASHFLPRLGGARDRLIARFGRRYYFAAYGVLSTALLVWVIVAAGRAPFVALWPQAPWMRWGPNIAMPLAVMLTATGIGMTQPFTLGGRRGQAFDPDDPGMAALSRHPLFVALALWAGAHLLANGDLAYVILFALFALMPLAAIPAFDAKARKALPAPEAARFFAASPVLSLKPLLDSGWRARNCARLLRRAGIGLLLWLILLMAHQPVLGVSPLPI